MFCFCFLFYFLGGYFVDKPFNVILLDIIFRITLSFIVIVIFMNFIAFLFLQVDRQLEAERNLAPAKKVRLDCY